MYAQCCHRTATLFPKKWGRSGNFPIQPIWSARCRIRLQILPILLKLPIFTLNPNPSAFVFTTALYSLDCHYRFSSMTGFPSLQPAFTVRVKIDAPMQVGGQAGPGLVIVPMVSGTVKSEGKFEPKLDGELYVYSHLNWSTESASSALRLLIPTQTRRRI